MGTSGDLKPEPKSPVKELMDDELTTWLGGPWWTCENGALDALDAAAAAAAAIVAPAEW